MYFPAMANEDWKHLRKNSPRVRYTVSVTLAYISISSDHLEVVDSCGGIHVKHQTPTKKNQFYICKNLTYDTKSVWITFSRL